MYLVWNRKETVKAVETFFPEVSNSQLFHQNLVKKINIRILLKIITSQDTNQKFVNKYLYAKK